MTGGAAQVGSCGVADRDSLLYELTRVQEIGTAIEDHLDRRELRHRLGADHVEVGQPLECLLQWNGDQPLHLARGEPERARLYLDLRRRELREDVDLRLRKCQEPEDQQRGSPCGHDEAEPQARSNDPSHHVKQDPQLDPTR